MNLRPVLDHFKNWRRWELNPVVVKELRQAVRSWAVTGMLLLFLVVLFCTSLAFLIGQSFVVGLNQRVGGEIFQAFLAVLAGASLVFIPIYIGIRLAAERHGTNLDLLYITTLSPGRVIRGKFFCGVYIAVLFFSACMPFMAFTNLLRGVDLPTIFFILVFVFLVVCAAIQVAIFIACLPVSTAFKVLLALPATGLFVFMVGPVVFASFEMMRSGVGAMMGSRHFWAMFLSNAAIALAGLGILYFLSVALISPPSANRALPLRLYVTLVWLAGGGLSVYWMSRETEVRFLWPWCIMTLVLMAIALVNVISNNDQLSLRVRRRIPRSSLGRFLAFLFYNGAAGGLLWIGLITLVTLGGTVTVLNFRVELFPTFRGPRPDELEEFFVLTTATTAYALAYALTALFLHRTLIPRRTSKLAGTMALLLPGVWAVLPNLVLFFINKLSWDAVEKLQLGNIFNVFVLRDPAQRSTHLAFACVWLLVVLLLVFPWFLRQLRAFQPLYPAQSTPEPEGKLATA